MLIGHSRLYPFALLGDGDDDCGRAYSLLLKTIDVLLC